jgi:hypothetical protein
MSHTKKLVFIAFLTLQAHAQAHAAPYAAGAAPVAAPVAAPAGPQPERKPVAQEDIMKQETVALGNNRFLIFSGTAGERGQYGYTVDLIKIDGGIPRFDPLFIEEYNPDLNRARLEYGVAFMCTSYHYDRPANLLNFTIDLEDTGERLLLKYRLDVDILRLVEVMSQKTGPCPQAPCKPGVPRTIFKGAGA